ncbi:hypothetical protein PC9H_004143 [Pleurotus ostreatus]|uniref:Ras modification protein ERF4 n=1 Tax=Pleurotus ostreatus TaxID=5322 RepID=A0A8H7A259_PLEOS|nr:uncharacterized protein PC9H_004143 [Pleurotus ostreatus]KAF7437304.1 hypothetical protein PC9H_004143 [Pleurotus ostreatus]
MTEAHHDLPSSEPEPRAAGLVDTPLPHDDNTHNPASTIAASTATRALIDSTADSASTSGAELGPGPGPSLVDNSNNSEGVAAAASSRMLTVEETKGSFLELARTPEPDLEADGEDEYAPKGDIRGARRESDQEAEVDGNTNSSNVPEPAADGIASRTDPQFVTSTSPALQGTTTSGNDSGYEVEEENETTIRDDSWHPLSPHVPPKQEKGVEDDEEAVHSGQDMTMVVEEGDVVDSRGRLMYSVDEEVDEKLSAVNSPRRASHLRLNLKASSPQPWELVDPPDSNGHQTKPEHELESRFHSLQSRHRSLVPKSSYYFGPPAPDSAYGTAPIGQIGLHHPREILRIERDYTGGELIQFAPIYPLELEGRITPTQFLESINAMNELLISAHSLRHSFFDNVLAVLTLQLSRIVTTSHYEKEMQRLQQLFDDLNARLFNPVGLNLLWPRKVAFLYLEIEYYVRVLQPRFSSPR